MGIQDSPALLFLPPYFFAQEKKSLYKHFPVFLMDPLTCAEHAGYVDVRPPTNQLYEFTPLKFTSTPLVYDVCNVIQRFDIVMSGDISGC